ncbi:VWA domain-containing protein [Vibrio sp. ZSDE26]|uniref:VWA domain-containing protein n=1 Tax=Vibrio amylolyticus TaxID=2847292 RepID=A0A9X2BJT0_9VIBR|nr:VWA domain-containing protein [Vibrio amylolyticus]MCK6263737.1 VWA domain-containing protein [Vibrio amylolyticus]
MSNFTFLYPLWLIALIPAMALTIWLGKNTHQVSLIAPHLAKAIGIENTPRRKSLIYMITAGMVVTIIALSGPSFYSSDRPVYGNSGGRIVVMDMSLSMYANDIKPNRLTQARYKVTDLLNVWQEGSTGLVAYAGDAYTVSPMTTDSQTLLNLLPNLSPDIMPYPGADAASGVALAIEMMQNAGLDQGEIILVADDIDNAEKSAIKTLLDNTQWRLSILAIATSSGAPIRLSDGSLLRDDNGTTVIAQSNFSNMKTLARSVDGLFTAVQADSRDVELIANYTSQVAASTSSLQQQQLEERVNSGYWLIPLLIVPVSLLFRRGVIFTIAILGLSIGQPNLAYANPWKTSDQQAIDLYNAEDYQQAAELFSNDEWRGIAQYQAGDFKGAIESLEKIDSDRARYNLANAQAQNGDFEQAIDNYNQLIQQGKFVKEATENLEIVKRAQEQQQQQDSSGQNNEDSSDSQDGKQSGDNQQKSNDRSESDDNSESNSSSDDASTNSDEQSPSTGQQPNSQNEPNDGSDSPESSNSQPNEENTQAQQQTNNDDTSQAESMNDQEPESSQSATSAAQDNQESVDPAIRKLEQVENARDPSRLLQAQMLLQAQQKQPPQNTGKKW